MNITLISPQNSEIEDQENTDTSPQPQKEKSSLDEENSANQSNHRNALVLKKQVQRSSQKKINRKFAPVTPNTIEDIDDNNRTTSIQTDVTFKNQKKDTYRLSVIKEEDDEPELNIVRGQNCSTQFNNKATQTVSMTQNYKYIIYKAEATEKAKKKYSTECDK